MSTARHAAHTASRLAYRWRAEGGSTRQDVEEIHADDTAYQSGCEH